MGIQKKDPTRMMGLAVHITCPPVWHVTRSLGEARQGLSACPIWSDYSRESPSRLSNLEGLEKDVSGICLFSCDPHTDGSFPSRLRNNTRHGSCKMPSKYGLSRFHASPSVLLLTLTVLKQAEFCSSTRNIQKQPVRQSNNQSHKTTICELPEQSVSKRVPFPTGLVRCSQWTRELRQQPLLRNLAMDQLRKIT